VQVVPSPSPSPISPSLSPCSIQCTEIDLPSCSSLVDPKSRLTHPTSTIRHCPNDNTNAHS
jgi:hypothetical protein